MSKEMLGNTTDGCSFQPVSSLGESPSSFKFLHQLCAAKSTDRGCWNAMVTVWGYIAISAWWATQQAAGGEGKLVYGLGRTQGHMHCCTILKYPLALTAHVHILLQHLPNPSMARLWLTTTSSKLCPSLAVVVSRSPSRFIKCTVTSSSEL